MFVVFGVGLTLAVMLERWLARYCRYRSSCRVGFVIWSLPLGLPHFNPTVDGFDAITLEYATEFIVIASLMAAGIMTGR